MPFNLSIRSRLTPGSASSIGGYVLIRILSLILVIGAIMSALSLVVIEIRGSIACANNLESIYRALSLYEVERGSLPALAYFPDDPIDDSDSLAVMLEPYGLTRSHCICPAAREIQRNEGQTYLWNIALNGQRIPHNAEPVWMLVDMNALSDEVPASHLGGYNVLFSDGKVRRMRDPRRTLLNL